MISKRAKRGLLVTQLALALAAAGCGGGGNGDDTLSKREYGQKVQSVGAQLLRTFRSVSGGSTGLSRLPAQLDKAGAALRSTAAQLDAVDPPRDARADNDLLVRGMRRLADAVDRLEQAAREKDAQKIAQTLQQLQRSSAIQDLQKATGDLARKGYSVGVLGR